MIEYCLGSVQTHAFEYVYTCSCIDVYGCESTIGMYTCMSLYVYVYIVAETYLG